MNIFDRFYCSRCLAEIQSDEEVCPKCGYNPCGDSDGLALEEGTTLDRMRFHVGAVRRRLRAGYVYGAFDYVKGRPVYLFEYFPPMGLVRDEESGSRVIVPGECKADFTDGMKRLAGSLSPRHKFFLSNNTLYVFRP
ncbi:MAG: hypothetical protein II877_03850 [Synergistaceae bacterium]|nr:hypothetical protein [Synergistaceae bacterium]MBQ6972780.1 hypothetical protein [Synergistaceae bacterium]